MDKQAVVKVVADQVATEVNSEVVILNTRSGVYFGLNELGSFIWQLIQQPTTVASIENAILAEYNASPQQVEQDVSALLQKLSDAGLIEVDYASAS